ncbi:MAG TPA: sigma-70 family RNA polymerase sigma factor [Kofleriaceae bacterium]|jgi:RNA polymerase sigma-70 factor (ECF subfamily)
MSGRDDDALARWLEAARQRWPEVSVDPADIAGHLAGLGVATAPLSEHAADLVLAFACARGDSAAVAVFDREMTQVMRSAARRIDDSADFGDEVAQAARERLLVARDDGPPRIAEYGGQGALAAWVRVAAMRIAMNLLRERRRNVLVDDEAFFDAAVEGGEDERAAARARYGEACAESLRAAFATLTARERNLLRMHHLHGLTVDELAPSFGVHRATVARWLAAARERLLTETRAGLRERLGVGDATVDSILRELRGRVDVTVTRLLID